MASPEAEEEMEALEAIFADEFERLSSTSCRITATPNCEPPFHISCHLEWHLPASYPSAAPELVIHDIKGLNQAWNQELRTKLLDDANANLLGSAMIFSLVDLAREWLTERNVPGLGEDSMHSKMMRAQYAKQMQDESDSTAAAATSAGSSAIGGVTKTKSAESAARKLRDTGTAVNQDTFAKWMQHCLQREDNQAKQALAGKQVKLTGRQIFEQGGKAVPGVDESEEGGAVEGEDFDPRLLQQRSEEEEDEEEDDDDEEDEDDDDDEEEEDV